MEVKGRIMALDVGDVRTGVAVTDELQILVSPHSVIREPSREKTVDAVCALVTELAPRTLVVGLPITEAGETGPQAEKVLMFVELLKKKIDTPIALEDERYSTAAADEVLRAASVKGKRRKRVVDMLAAADILRTYMARLEREAR